MVQEIELEKLFIHPKNVRKTYNDIEELADSIREKGILQNLTVVPGHFVTDKEWRELAEEYAVNPTEEIRGRMNAKASGAAANGWSDYGYTVVIGNRRLTAARIAGIKTAPCAVVEMSEAEQATTMLLENMQRKDLTAYEESCGMQMCLDLGMSEEDLSKKTGLSKKTIKHRTKIQLLNQETVEEKCAAGATIFDFIKLEQIKDIEKRNAVLEDMGTPNFNYRLESTIREEKKEEAKEKVIELYKSFATEIDGDSAREKQFCFSWCLDLNKLPEKPEDAGEVKYYYKVESWGIMLYKEREETPEPEEPTQAQIDRIERDKRNAQFAELGKTFYEMRRKHLENKTRPLITPAKIYKYMTLAILLDNINVEWKEEKDRPYGDTFDEDIYTAVRGGNPDEAVKGEEVLERVEKDPLREMERIIYSIFEKGDGIPCKTWDGMYEENTQFENLYLFLQDIGYILSEAEMQILGGTHPAYKEREE